MYVKRFLLTTVIIKILSYEQSQIIIIQGFFIGLFLLQQPRSSFTCLECFINKIQQKIHETKRCFLQKLISLKEKDKVSSLLYYFTICTLQYHAWHLNLLFITTLCLIDQMKNKHISSLHIFSDKKNMAYVTVVSNVSCQSRGTSKVKSKFLTP